MIIDIWCPKNNTATLLYLETCYYILLHKRLLTFYKHDDGISWVISDQRKTGA